MEGAVSPLSLRTTPPESGVRRSAMPSQRLFPTILAFPRPAGIARPPSGLDEEWAIELGCSDARFLLLAPLEAGLFPFL